MTTLNAIGFTTAGSSVVAICAFTFFSIAVRTANPKIAPRCTARAPETVYNSKARRKTKIRKSVTNFFGWGAKTTKTKNTKDKVIDKDGKSHAGNMIENSGGSEEDGMLEEEEDNNPIHVQYRGGPMFGWIFWVMSLSYEQLLKGVPGTGTRKNGMEGSMLKVNLDGIVLLRFHAICLRVAILATILGLFVVLPINLTANCYRTDAGNIDCYSPTFAKNITNYEMTTIENIPVLEITDEFENEYSWYNSIFGASFKLFGSSYGSFLGRLYAIVAVSWILIFYCLHIVRKEWIDALALRRIFYLESRHWENRVDELHDTVLKDDFDEDDDDYEDDRKRGALRRRRFINKGGKTNPKKRRKKKKNYSNDRPPWIPHPEQRDTVPNIELYSVLVGQIPSAPSELANENNDGNDAAAIDIKSAIDWQLRVTTTFFDQCVPNQPGFSSSVAAVTMLPDAPKLAAAWKAWYKHCSLLRRLRFIRELIEEKRHYNIDECMQNYLDESSRNFDENGNSHVSNNLDGEANHNNEQQTVPNVGSQDYLDDDYPGAGLGEAEMDEYTAIKQRIKYYSNVFGADINDLFENDMGANPNQTAQYERSLMTQLLSYGPEQTAVYSKEFARGAASCCPNGCREEKIRELFKLRDLEELQEELQEKVKESFNVLVKIQQENVMKEVEDPPERVKNQASSDDVDVEMQLFSRTPTKFSASHTISYDTSVFPQNKFYDDDIDGQEKLPSHENHSNLPHQSIPSPRNLNLLPPRPPVPSQFSASNPHMHSDSSMGKGSQFKPAPMLTLSNQGKVYYKEITTVGSHMSEIEEGSHVASWSVQTPRQQYSQEIDDQATFPSFTRRRLDTGGFSVRSITQNLGTNKISDWERVQQAVKDNNVADGGNQETRIASGIWKMPSVSSVLKRAWMKVRFPFTRTFDAVDEIKSTTTFAVVTFTSRQAAVAARHCLADGRGVGRWVPVENIPVPPLADAAVCDFCDCRGCCKPVTMTIHPKQQLLRRYATIFMLSCIFIFYTLPLTFASAFVAPEKLNNIIPGIQKAASENLILNNLLSGILPAFFYSLFFALCPIMFKTLSNFGSNAVSLNQAEFIALQYYWWFMLTTGFSGTSLTTMALNFFNEKGYENASIQSVLLSIASALPTQVSATWLNWIIFRTFCTLPLMYMLNVHTFIFQMLGWKCCIRCVLGGGPGGPIPYRIYIDSGVVFMCIMCLSPIAPLLAPAALLYFLYCAPLWRRNCIYMYRPNFDTGGIRWPFLSDIFISAIFAAQTLLTTVMALKKALGPAICSGLILIPVYLHRRSTRKKYLRSYMDAALLQTSQLDGWDNTMPTSKEMREEYRKFLVDAHRAAYVPICLAGEEARGLTNEPAVVVPHPNDILEPIPLQNPSGNFEPPDQDTIQTSGTPMSAYNPLIRYRVQPGASYRRVQLINSFNEEDSH